MLNLSGWPVPRTQPRLVISTGNGGEGYRPSYTVDNISVPSKRPVQRERAVGEVAVSIVVHDRIVAIDKRIHFSEGSTKRMVYSSPG